MNINELKTSNFLKRTDVGDGTIVTIRRVDQQNVAKEGAPEELKWCLHVDEFDKGMVLNSTNGQLIAHALKSEDSDDWTGKQIVLFDDPSVSFGGKLVGGIRVRPVPGAARKPANVLPAKPSPAAAPAGEVSTLTKLKKAFRSHHDFDKKFKAVDINDQLTQKYNTDLNGLTEEQAEEVFADFDGYVERASDMPF